MGGGNQTVLVFSSANEEDTVISCLLNQSLSLLPNSTFTQYSAVQRGISYCVILTPHKGFGMFATRDIVAGELVVIEQPSSHPARCFLPEEAYNEIGLQLPKGRTYGDGK